MNQDQVVKQAQVKFGQAVEHFKDDPTHVRVYSVQELAALFAANQCTVLKGGTRRNGWFIAAMPFRIVASWLQGKKLQGNIFWDLLGFAEYMWVRKG